MNIVLFERTGDFAEDKDIAAEIRTSVILPTVSSGERVTLDFSGVGLVTQSVVHALIADVLRTEGEEVLDHLVFKGCNAGVKGIVETVVQYSLETMNDE